MISSRSFSNRKVWSIMWNLSIGGKIINSLPAGLISRDIYMCWVIMPNKMPIGRLQKYTESSLNELCLFRKLSQKFAGSCETSRNFSIHKAIKVQYSAPCFHRLNPMPHQLSNYSISLVAVWAYRHYYSPPSFFYWNFSSYMQHESLLTRISLPIVSINQPSSSRQ